VTVDGVAGGDDRARLRRFDTQAEAEAALAKALKRGERAFVSRRSPLGATSLPPCLAQVRDQFAVDVALLAIDKDPRAISQSMVDMRGTR
jgi:hypothetical protein